MNNRRSERGFTLMELMVVIVIVAILAAVAVPLYINYVRDAQRTEARAAIGAINTAQQVFFQRNMGASYASDLATLEGSGNLDITEAKSKWDFTISNATQTGFDVKAAGKADPTLTVCYTYTRSSAAADSAGGRFTDTCP